MVRLKFAVANGNRDTLSTAALDKGKGESQPLRGKASSRMPLSRKG